MDTALLALSLLLAAVFAVAGFAKLSDPAGSRRALEDFGVPAGLARPGGMALPLAELAIAGALVFPPTARWGAIAASALLAAFAAAIANALRQGKSPDCGCFGQAHSSAASAHTLARNGALFALAAAVALFGPAQAVDTWVGDRTAGELALAGAIVVVAALAAVGVRLGSRRQHSPPADLGADDRAAERRPGGLALGAQAPSFRVRRVGGGGETTLEELLSAGRPVALIFVSTTCGGCQRVLGRLGEWERRLGERITLAVLGQGDRDAIEALRERFGLANFLLQDDRGVYDAYEPGVGRPAAVVVDPGGTIASSTVGGEPAIEELIRFTLRRGRVPEPSAVA